jgi:DNA polymerase elongation subunit (family B)
MEDISKTIKKLDLKQNAIKLLINSIYGAFGNKWFYFYNTDIAQSITLQGQDLIGFSIKAVNHYFMNMWHTDTELHEKLGISQFTIEKIDDEAAIYTDTDSIYVQFDSAIKSIKGASFNHEEALAICVGIDRYRLAQYYEKCFDKYGKLFNTKNRQTFKLENLS